MTKMKLYYVSHLTIGLEFCVTLPYKIHFKSVKLSKYFFLQRFHHFYMIDCDNLTFALEMNIGFIPVRGFIFPHCI